MDKFLRPARACTAAAALAAVLALSGCGGQASTDVDHRVAGSSATPTPEPHNAADIEFAAMMVPHHAQALAMTDIVLARDDLNPAILDLATDVKTTQAPQMAKMIGWNAAWGEPQTSATPMSMDDMGHTGMSMDVLSATEMDDLRNATRPQAVQIYLAYLINNHQGAIEMADTEVAGGTNPAAIALAEEIISVQTPELAAMQDLLTG